MIARATLVLLMLLLAAPAPVPGVSVYIDLEGRVVGRTETAMTYAGTLAILDKDAPERMLPEWVGPMEIEVNGRVCSLPASPRTTRNGFGFFVYDWSLEVPASPKVRLTVTDRENGHRFFGGALVASGGSSLEIFAHDADLDCGGSTTSRRPVPAELSERSTCDRLRDKLLRYRSLHSVDLRRRP